MTDKQALYFGCWDRPGHYLHGCNGHRLYDAKKEVPGFPWSVSMLDGGLLENGMRQDKYDGKVFSTCGGTDDFWWAFYWWDNSIDTRRGSNSGFYVRGFGLEDEEAAFKYACEQWPGVVSRQEHPLILQSVNVNRMNIVFDNPDSYTRNYYSSLGVPDRQDRETEDQKELKD